MRHCLHPSLMSEKKVQEVESSWMPTSHPLPKSPDSMVVLRGLVHPNVVRWIWKHQHPPKPHVQDPRRVFCNESKFKCKLKGLFETLESSGYECSPCARHCAKHFANIQLMRKVRNLQGHMTMKLKHVNCYFYTSKMVKYWQFNMVYLKGMIELESNRTV